MFRRILLLLLAAMLPPDRDVSADPPAPDRPATVITPADIRPHVEYLASPELQGRGDPRTKNLAARYLIARFEELGLQPLFGDSYFQDVPGPKDEEGRKTRLGRNVGAFLPGDDPAVADEIIILSAHYDHLGKRGNVIYPGADDNASSVAMLLEVARHLQREPKVSRSVAFVCFDLEEHLLWGSRWFAAHPPWSLERVKLFITADLLGRSLGDLPLNTVFVMGSEHATGLKETLHQIRPAAELKVSPLGADLVGTRSDYGPFRDAEVPFLFFSSGEHPDYHTPRDTPERLDYGKLAGISNYITELCRRVANASVPPKWISKPQHELDEIHTLHRITELLLELDDQRREAGKPGLNTVQRLMVTNLNSRTAGILREGRTDPEDRPGLIRSAQLLLLAVF